ncbi:Uncharacterised protein, partial [Mycoplasmoides gallisepticum]
MSSLVIKSLDNLTIFKLASLIFNPLNERIIGASEKSQTTGLPPLPW